MTYIMIYSTRERVLRFPNGQGKKKKGKEMSAQSLRMGFGIGDGNLIMYKYT